MLVSLFKIASGFALGFVTRHMAGRRKQKGIIKLKKKNSASKPKEAYVSPREEFKMVLCVNGALKMGAGKIGAQCAHAACGVTQKHRPRYESSFRAWEYCGQAKIALKINNDDEMNELAARAASLGMPTYIVCDAGRTQIPAGSQTVLAIGPAPKSQVDQVTGHLRLL